MDFLNLQITSHHVAEKDATVSFAGFTFIRTHKASDPKGFCRLYLSNGIMTVELFPSKSLTIGQAWEGERPVFWNLPIHSLPDMSGFDLANDLLFIRNEPRRGFKWIEGYMGGIELLGLENWGMPWTDPRTGKFYSLHGEVNTIAVPTIELKISARHASVHGAFVVRSFEGPEELPRYERGEGLFSVARTIVLESGAHGLVCKDEITNISDLPRSADWGYHVTFRPEEGAALLIPSSVAKKRFGGPFDDSIETWKAAKDQNHREEYGVIHQGLKFAHESSFGCDMAQALLLYPAGFGTRLSFPPSPYCQSWISMGGKGSSEFCRLDGKSILHNSWDGIGLEFGASSLDHDGFIDPSVPQRTLQPGETMTIPLAVDLLAPTQANTLASEIRQFNSTRKKLL